MVCWISWLSPSFPSYYYGAIAISTLPAWAFMSEVLRRVYSEIVLMVLTMRKIITPVRPTAVLPQVLVMAPPAHMLPLSN